MFFHLFYYKIKQLIHNRGIMLWVFLFPLLLGTLFHLGFGHLMQANEDWEPIPIAAVSVESEEENSELKQVIEELSKKKQEPLFATTWTTEKKALQLLKQKKIDGIIYLQKEPSLTLLENGLNQSILNSFLSMYLSQSNAMQQIGKEHPEKLTQAARQLTSDVSYNQEKSANNSKQNNLIQYFYALIAMVCLYGNSLGQETAFSIQPHLSDIGARKNVAPVHKLSMILSEFLAGILVNYLSVLLLFFYLIFILGIDFGSRLPQILLASLVGSVIGVSFGLFTASLGKGSQTTKEGISSAIVMLCCFLGGLMVNTMPNIIQHNAPWINKINPATLLSDSFYSLNVYTDFKRYQQNLLSMLIIAGILCFSSYLLLRKKTMD